MSSRSPMPTLAPQRQVNRKSPGSPTHATMAHDNNAHNAAARSSSPSGLTPSEVLQDLIDATAHQIISVESSADQSESFYATLAVRLGLYMNQYTDVANESGDDHNDLFDDEAKPLIDDVNVRCRLLMARLMLDLMLKNSDVNRDETTTTYVSNVKDLDAGGWKNIHDDLKRLVQWLVETEKIDADADEVQNIQAHLKAFQSVALLRSQLKSTVGKIASRRKQKISQYTNTTVFMASYRDARDEISAMSNVVGGSVDDLLLLPDEVISFNFPKSVKTLKELLERIIHAMDDFVEGETVPLKALQSNLSTTLQSWERRLDRPALYECGYFKSSSPSHSSETKPASSANANRKSHRHEDDSSEDLEDSDDDQILMKIKKSKSNQVKSKTMYRSDSDDDTLAEHPPQKKRRKRIPYSEEEKTALLDGVKKFGKGKWTEILDDNADLFAVNKRTNINLKDLYRNLTK